MASLKNTAGKSIFVNDGTESSPKNIINIVTDIADTTWIEKTGNDIYLKKNLDIATGFLSIPVGIIVHENADAHIVNSRIAIPSNGIITNGIVIIGSGCTIKV